MWPGLPHSLVAGCQGETPEREQEPGGSSVAFRDLPSKVRLHHFHQILLTVAVTEAPLGLKKGT